MTESKLDLLQGTLDVMVLQTLLTMGAMHGYGIARRIEQMSGDEPTLVDDLLRGTEEGCAANARRARAERAAAMKDEIRIAVEDLNMLGCQT